MKASMGAADNLPGRMTACSTERGWTSLLLRRYDEPLEAEFETLPTTDQLIVLVRAGACTIESRSGRGWRSSAYRAGDLGMTPPGESTRLRFYGPTAHQTLHLHIPGMLLAQTQEAAGRPLPRLDDLRTTYTLAATVIGQLERGLATGAPALYAEAAIHYLLLQMLVDTGTFGKRRRAPGKVEQVDAYMRANLSSNSTTLADVAAVVDLSVFQLIRLCRSAWGMTPAARLTMLRLEQARYLLQTTHDPVTSVAMECGYESPAHFAAAFRRRFGLTPMKFRLLHDS